MIDVKDLVFEYPTGRALDGVTCAIRCGSVTALVGPNGAGKTTFIRCIVGLYEPFYGSVLFEGQDVFQNCHDAHRKMGYLTDFFGVYEKLTARRCLTFAAMAHGMDDDAVEPAVAKAAGWVGIEPHMDTKAGELSRGLRQRLAVAQTVIHEPAFVVMDEPASGLDPEARRELSRMMVALAGTGMTILVSSHILAELEDYCTDMLVMRDGRVVEQATLHGVADGTADGAPAPRRMRLDLAAPDELLAGKLALIDGVSNPAVDGLTATFAFTGDARAQQALLRRLIEGDAPIIALTEQKASLQDSYFAAMGAAEEES